MAAAVEAAGEANVAAGALLVLLVTNGMAGPDLSATVEALKVSSKSAGTHKRRQLYWDAYGKMASKAASFEGPVDAMFAYRMGADGEGNLEVLDLTKRQKGLVGGGCEIMGKKLKPPEEPGKSGDKWAVVWNEEDAATALDDLMAGEPCIYLTADGVYVATRFKRVLCKGLSGPCKTLKDVEKVVTELQPDKPLRSVAFAGNAPPSVNSYNTFLAGSWASAPLVGSLPASLGHVTATSTVEIYDYFQQRRSAQLVVEANKLLAQMLADVGKGLVPVVYASSMKDAATARKNALLKRAFVHESKGNFIEQCRAEESVELNVITGDVSATEFGKYGGVVIELHYRTDLGIF